MAGVTETMDLRVGEERAIHLPSLKAGGGAWSHEVTGMASAVSVRKLWEAAPYPEDDEEDDQPTEPQDEVFMVRGASPGEAVIRFAPSAGDDAPRMIEVRVRL
jgi:hypothetical protein